MPPAPAMAASLSMLDTPGSRFDQFERDLRIVETERSPQRLRTDLGRGCWIHGAGQYGRRLAGLLRGDGLEVLGFIDRRAGCELQTVMDLPVIHPDAFRPEDARERTFVGGVLNPLAASSDVSAWVESLPFQGMAVGADLPDALGEAAETCWVAGRALIRRNLERIRAVFMRLADRASQDIYLGLLNYRITGDATHFPAIDAADPYLPRDLPGFEGPIVFVDGGAYRGDTCAYLIGRGVEIQRYVAFEPDRRNYEALGRFVRTAPIAEAVLFPCGLAEGFKTVAFLDGQETSSRIVEPDGGASTIPCVGLDRALPGLRPDLVKMDIEGAEMAALQGMTETIERCRPRLAISIYHRPEDLWELPEWVGRRYARMHVRQHAPYGFDTVLYALAE